VSAEGRTEEPDRVYANGTRVEEGTTGDLLKQLAEQTTDLVRYEVDLAKAEFSNAKDEMLEKGKQTGKGAGMFGGAGLFGLFALSTLTVAFILGLGTLIPEWVAALIAAIAYGAAAAVLAGKGRHELQEAAPLVPEKTIESVQEDVEWHKSQK
jgi:hypothetical protein